MSSLSGYPRKQWSIQINVSGYQPSDPTPEALERGRKRRRLEQLLEEKRMRKEFEFN